MKFAVQPLGEGISNLLWRDKILDDGSVADSVDAENNIAAEPMRKSVLDDHSRDMSECLGGLLGGPSDTGRTARKNRQVKVQSMHRK